MSEGFENLASLIDHTLLRAEATEADIAALCDEAIEYGFHAVCVNPVHVRRAVDRIGAAKANVRVVSVAGFPLGANCPATKADEARRAMDEGASEVDMVVNLGALLAGERSIVRKDIEGVVQVVHGKLASGIVKVILETGTLPREAKILGCRCAAEGEADFVKTSTGFHSAGGATIEDVMILRRHASPLGIKASGGIRTLADAVAMIDAGATRLGISGSVSVMRELRGGAVDGSAE